ncbi:MAG: glycosyltransferase family 4 protein [Cyanobacteria bacterium J06634_5]
MNMKNTTHVLVAQMGARMHYAVPRILNRFDCLEQLFTDACASKGLSQALRFLPEELNLKSVKKLLGRSPEGISPSSITAFTIFGYEYAWRRRHAKSIGEMTAVHLWAGKKFNQLIIRQGFGSATTVYGYNSACEQLMREAKKKGLRTVLEQTIAPKSVEMNLLESESSKVDWDISMENSWIDEFVSRERREWALADTVICASDFVRQALIEEGAAADKCTVVPYGVDCFNVPVCLDTGRQRDKNIPLRVLFVGSVGLRKGVHYLLDAMRQLENIPIECRIVGGWNVDPTILHQDIPSNVTLVGAIPRVEVAHEYATADVFCLPSLCEGSATVIYEALAAGLPVVTTPNSGSIVRDGQEGFIVPIREADAIAAALEKLYLDRSLLEEMSHAALKRSQYGSFEAYSQRLLEALSCP